MVGRGPNKKPIKGVRQGLHEYKRGAAQLQKLNAERKLKRARAKADKLRCQVKLLQTSVDKLTLDLVQQNAQYFKRASKKVLADAAKDPLRPFSPVSIALAQLEQEPFVLNLSAVEKMREITVHKEETYARSVIPSRTSIQRVHNKINAGGELITRPFYSANNDLVTLDTRSVVEAVIESSNWPGLDAADVNPLDVDAQVKRLPILSIDATADGARLTASLRNILIFTVD